MSKVCLGKSCGVEGGGACHLDPVLPDSSYLAISYLGGYGLSLNDCWKSISVDFPSYMGASDTKELVFTHASKINMRPQGSLA